MGEDPTAEFASFYESNRDACLRAVLASSGDRGVAEDLVSEAFARAWTSWPKVRRHPAPAAWVVRTALNAGVSRWRKHRRERPLPAREVAVVIDCSEDVDTTLLAALRQLPARQREVVVLRVFLDLDTAATADALGVAPGTVTAHLSRAIATMRKALIPVGTAQSETRPTTTR